MKSPVDTAVDKIEETLEALSDEAVGEDGEVYQIYNGEYDGQSTDNGE